MTMQSICFCLPKPLPPTQFLQAPIKKRILINISSSRLQIFLRINLAYHLCSRINISLIAVLLNSTLKLKKKIKKPPHDDKSRLPEKQDLLLHLENALTSRSEIGILLYFYVLLCYWNPRKHYMDPHGHRVIQTEKTVKM